MTKPRPYAGYKLHSYGDVLDDDSYDTACNDLGYLFFKDAELGLMPEEEELFRKLIQLTDEFERKMGW